MFIGFVIITEIAMCLKHSKKLIEASSGWITSGTFIAILSAQGMIGAYTGVLETMTLIVLSSTYMFICFPDIIKSSQNQKP